MLTTSQQRPLPKEFTWSKRRLFYLLIVLLPEYLDIAAKDDVKISS